MTYYYDRKTQGNGAPGNRNGRGTVSAEMEEMEVLLTLKAARVNRQLTQREAAMQLSISEQTLSNYERAVSYPDVPMLQKMEALYGVEYRNLDFTLQ